MLTVDQRSSIHKEALTLDPFIEPTNGRLEQ